MLQVVYIFWIVCTNISHNTYWNIISSSWSNACISCQGIQCNDVFVFNKHLLDPYIYWLNDFLVQIFFPSYWHTFCLFQLLFYFYRLLLLLFFISFLWICFIIFNSILYKMFVVSFLICDYFLVWQSDMYRSVKMRDSIYCINDQVLYILFYWIVHN